MPLVGKSQVMAAIDDSIDSLEREVYSVFAYALESIVLGTPVGMITGADVRKRKDKSSIVGNGATSVREYTNARNAWTLSEGSPSFGLSYSESNYNDLPLEILGKTFYFINEKEYINNLEYGLYPSNPKKGSYDRRNKVWTKRSKGGWSKQAYNVGNLGWVRLTILEARYMLEGIKV